MATFTNSLGKTFPVQQRGDRYYYYSPLAGRRFQIAKSKVSF